jgi:hypothetical protein
LSGIIKYRKKNSIISIKTQSTMNLIINLYKAQKPSKYKILKAFEKKTLFQQTKPLGIAQRKF